MLWRVAWCVVVLTLLSAEHIGAQTVTDATSADTAAAIGATRPPPVHEREERRPPALVPLYLSLIGLQIADGVTTVAAVRDHNARELNPAMRPFADSTVSLLLIKTSATAGTMYAVEKLWKKNRVAAVLTMIGVNAMYAVVVTNNVRALP